jgi:AmpD protein
MTMRVLQGSDGHWLEGARRLSSPNCDARPDLDDLCLIVIHGISLPAGEFGGGHVDALFCNRLDSSLHPSFPELCENPVSAHLLIARDGKVTQYVPFDRRAWHAGVSSWQGREKCNDFSIGIELEGTDHEPYTKIQYQVLAEVVRGLLEHYPGLGSGAIAGHCDVAPDRKTDPGPAFDWDRFRRSLPEASSP